MTLKTGYILKKVMGSYMLVSTDGEASSMQTMNETGAFLWSLLEKGETVDSMVSAMIAEYDIDPDTAKADIEAFIAKLKSANLLNE